MTDAAAALNSLTQNNADNKVAAVRAGAIPPLVELLRHGDSASKEHAAGALINLSNHNDTNVAVEAIPLLVDFLHHGDRAVKADAAAALSYLTYDTADSDIMVAAVRAGAIPLLEELQRDGGSAEKGHAAQALRNIYDAKVATEPRRGKHILELGGNPHTSMVTACLCRMTLCGRANRSG